MGRLFCSPRRRPRWRRAVGGASLIVAAGGLVVLALASAMLAAAPGAMLSGIGFATLQPSLTLIAIHRPDPRRRRTGTGLFVAVGTALRVAGFTLAGAGIIARG